MAGCGSRKKKYSAGGMPGGMSEEDKKTFGEKETDLPPPDNFKKSKPNKDLKPVPKDKKKSLGKLPEKVRNRIGFAKTGGHIKKMKNGGKVKRDGICKKGKTKGRMV
jgi:hypothetical protein